MNKYCTFKHFCPFCKTLSIPFEIEEITGHLRSNSTACTGCDAQYSVRVAQSTDGYSVTTKCVALPPSSK